MCLFFDFYGSHGTRHPAKTGSFCVTNYRHGSFHHIMVANYLINNLSSKLNGSTDSILILNDSLWLGFIR